MHPDSHRTPVRIALLAGLAVLAATGCRGPVRFPTAPVSESIGGTRRCYDTDGDGRADYFTSLNADGRKTRLAYDTDGDGRMDEVIDFGEIDPAETRHVALILDGVPFDLVEECYREGRFRLFHPPARLIAPFPTMTDLALADALGSERPTGFEAQFYDQAAHRLGGGDRFYLAMKNEPWVRYLDYRAGAMTDALGYVYPEWTFDRELTDAREAIDRVGDRDVAVYLVSTAGVGSRHGREGLKEVLHRCDRLVEELVWKSRGRVRVTVFADHGHTLQRCERVDFRKFLGKRGWHVGRRLAGPRDVVPIEYGLVTYASFAAGDAAALARDLAEHPAVTFVTYRQAESVVVRSRDGVAYIERRGDRFRYRAMEGDPLGLQPVQMQLHWTGRLDRGGFASDTDWLTLTATHAYPDAPARLWRTFHGLAENPPDVIANLSPGSCAGAASKRFWLPYMASTHGDLGRGSSTTFIMSMVGPLAPPATDRPAWRSREIPEALTALLGRRWPAEAGPAGSE